MKIAVLGWGSLIWDRRSLKIIDNRWYDEGPSLPIEFARISQGGRLTLVIKPNWKEVVTLYSVSSFTDLEKAIENLREREETPLYRIGFYNFVNGENHIANRNEPLLKNLLSWREHKDIDAAIWTDLPPNFRNSRNLDFSLVSIRKVLQGFSKDEFKSAKAYIQNAPKQINTSYRSEIEQMIKSFDND